MIFLVFLSSGLFLGWSLGANDAANIFGAAIGSRMIRFKTAAWIGSIFVVLGAVIQGQGGAETLNKLSAISSIEGAFIVALCAGLTVFTMVKRSMPVSTSQAIVGAIVGWSYYSGNQPDYATLGMIASTWVSGPILGMFFSATLYLLIRGLLKRTNIHIIKLNLATRIGLIVVGAFGAYSLGANNIANVMGVFVNSAPEMTLDLGFITFGKTHILFFIGSVSIAVGIATYGKNIIKKIGSEIMTLTPESALIVVLAQSMVLFVFSSKAFSNLLINIGLPPFPLVPVSSTQVVIGAIVGIGLMKGIREIKMRVLVEIAAGWVITPLAGALVTYIVLFFAENVFLLSVI